MRKVGLFGFCILPSILCLSANFTGKYTGNKLEIANLNTCIDLEFGANELSLLIIKPSVLIWNEESFIYKTDLNIGFETVTKLSKSRDRYPSGWIIYY